MRAAPSCCGKSGRVAAGYIAIIGGVLVYLLHAIEFKLNKLRDYHGIRVTDKEISRD
jgi:hypothetical protein